MVQWKTCPDTQDAGQHCQQFNPLTPGAANIRGFIFYQHIRYHILNMLKVKCDINQQDLKRVDPNYIKS